MTKTLLSLFSVLVCTFSAVSALDLEALHPIGAVQTVHRTANGILIDCQDQSQVGIEVLAPDLVRVRAAFRKPLPPNPHSWAIAKFDWTTPEWTLAEDGPALRLTTQAVEVEIARAPLRISFRDPRDHADINNDFQPMLFDTRTGGFAVEKRLGFEEHFYGLGEKASRLDRRRGRFTMWNTDAYRYVEGTDPLYQSIPFYIGLENGRAYGLFYDNSFRSSFDFGSSSEEFASFAADGGPMTYYFFAGPSMKQIVQRYTELTGRMPLPPRWALGVQQSRYSYYPASEVLKVAQTYRAHDLPLEIIHLDINYMRGYRDFTFDPKHYPDPKELTGELAKLGVKVVTIIDPGVKFEPQDNDYPIFNEGVQKEFFVHRKNGALYVGKVWPGDAVFVDYSKDAAARWWGDQFRGYLDKGIAGIWTDMNEPSDFIDPTGAKSMDVVYDDGGRGASYLQNRNVFALQMAKATYEGLQRARPNERPYVITRAGFAGIQRYSTMWTGDNTASWDSLSLSIPMFESLGMSGESFVGADVGGFIGRSNAELLTRWYQVGFLTPFFRNHAEMGGYDHEPWRFGPYYEDIIRKYLKLRYRLLPFLYTQIAESHRTGLPLFRPLLLNYQDDANALTIDDEFMVGDDLLAAPILKPDQDSRSVYLPAGNWYDFWTNQQLQGGRRIKVEAPLEKIPLFVRAGAVIPLGPEMNWSGEKPLDPLTFTIYPDAQGAASGSVYEDDGSSPAYLEGQFRRTGIIAAGGDVRLQKPEGSFTIAPRQIIFQVAGQPKTARVSDNGAEQRVTLH